MAINNPSSKEKTVLGMMRTRPSDTWQIDNLTILLNFRNGAIIQGANILDEYRDYFETSEKIETVTLDKKYHYSPSLFAEFYYGSADLDFLILYFAKISTIFDFNRKEITCLKPEYLKDINKLMIAVKDQVSNYKINPELVLNIDKYTTT